MFTHLEVIVYFSAVLRFFASAHEGPRRLWFRWKHISGRQARGIVFFQGTSKILKTLTRQDWRFQRSNIAQTRDSRTSIVLNRLGTTRRRVWGECRRPWCPPSGVARFDRWQGWQSYIRDYFRQCLEHDVSSTKSIHRQNEINMSTPIEIFSVAYKIHAHRFILGLTFRAETSFPTRSTIKTHEYDNRRRPLSIFWHEKPSSDMRKRDCGTIEYSTQIPATRKLENE